MRDRTEFWQKTQTVFIGTFICCFLWGSAFPCIKIGYELFRVGSADVHSQMLFAGLRFAIAGVLVVIAGSVIEKRFLRPWGNSADGWRLAGRILILAMLQTIGQYFFFYIGLAHASGVSSSIVGGTGTFFSILVAALIFRTERLTARKIIGCIVGFAGVVLVELNGADLTQIHFAWNGEGFIMIANIMSALSASYIKKAGQKDDPMMLCGWQFMLGGLVLAAFGAAGGGHLAVPAEPIRGVLLLFYMACISAVAYTLWSVLLKYNPVSRITIFGFMNPVIGVILSALLLGESGQALRLASLGALVLVSAGIVIVNGSGNTKSQKPKE